MKRTSSFIVLILTLYMVNPCQSSPDTKSTTVSSSSLSCFILQRPKSFLFSSSTSSCLHLSSYNQGTARRNISLPLLDIISYSTSSIDPNSIQDKDDDDDKNTTSSSNYKNVIIPLPSSHLPEEIRTLNTYGLQLNAPIHKMMIEQVTSSNNQQSSSMTDFVTFDLLNTKIREPATYGHIVHKESDTSLVGAIGVASEILLSVPSDSFSIDPVDITDDTEIMYNDFDDNLEEEKMDQLPESSITVVSRGAFRFVVKEVKQTFPFPIAIVDEYLDDAKPDPSPTKTSLVTKGSKNYNDIDEDDDDEEEDDDDMYADLNTSQLVPRLLAAMKAIVDQKLDIQPKTMTVLEKSILENQGVNSDLISAMNSIQREQAEELAATFDVFQSELLDIAPMPVDRFYAVAFLAAEFAGLNNDIRRQIITTTNGIERMRIVLKEVEEKISLVSAKKITDSIMGKNDESSKDLKVGEPILPEWTKRIKKGTKLEYFWNEEYGWCSGTVVEDPIKILDELIVTVLFEDGEIHKLPFRADEKVRWRPI